MAYTIQKTFRLRLSTNDRNTINIMISISSTFHCIMCMRPYVSCFVSFTGTRNKTKLSYRKSYLPRAVWCLEWRDNLSMEIFHRFREKIEWRHFYGWLNMAGSSFWIKERREERGFSWYRNLEVDYYLYTISDTFKLTCRESFISKKWNLDKSCYQVLFNHYIYWFKCFINNKN